MQMVLQDNPKFFKHLEHWRREIRARRNDAPPIGIGARAQQLNPRDYTLMTYHKRSEEHTSELQSQSNLVCRLLLEKKKKSAHMQVVALDNLRGRATWHTAFWVQGGNFLYRVNDVY